MADADAIGHLRRQHAMLLDRIGRLKRMAAAVEKAMEARTMGINLTPEERFEVFGDFDPDQHAAEAEERWGDTDAYKESQRRVARYTKADWQRIKAEGQAAIETVVAAMKAGKPADSPEAMDGAEAHRRHINTPFYDLLVRDPRRPGRDVPRRPAIHRDLREHRARAGAVPPRRDQGQRRPPGCVTT